MDIVGKRRIFLITSGILTLIAIVFIALFGFKLSIEFTGGSHLDVTSSRNIDTAHVEKVIEDNKIKVVSIKKKYDKDILIRTATITNAQKNTLIAKLNEAGLEIKEKSFETLGLVVGSEARMDALKAVGLALVAITLYIAFAFRKVSHPVSSWKFGFSAIIGLLHDVILVLGIFSALGLFFGIEIDTLFITAILTIMGFSVHDTIVVFDRIRENLIRNVRHLPFEQVVNNSFNETLVRSLNTSITVVLVLFALLLFGGESIRWFVFAFIVGMIVGTYSSIFIASGILVEWYELDKRGFKMSGYIKKPTLRKPFKKK